MTTNYWTGGEDTSYLPFFGAIVSSTSSTNIRTAFSRIGFGPEGGSGSAADPPANRMPTPVFSSISQFWVHGQFGSVVTIPSNATLSNGAVLRLLDSSGVARIVIRGTGTNGQVKISTRNAAGSFVDLVTSAANAFPDTGTGYTPFAVDLYINYSASGQATLYIDGAPVADTGPGVDITTDGATSLAQADFETFITGGGVPATSWSECRIQDTNTLGIGVWTLAPAAAGNTQSWTPSTVANINKTTINDATSIGTPSNNALSEWTTNYTPPGGNWLIVDVTQEARVSVGLTGPQHFEWLVRTADGSDHVQGSVAPITSFTNFNGAVNGGVWSTNPHTGSAWAISDFTTGFNIGLESLP